MENQRSQFAVTDVALDHGRDGADRAKAYIGGHYGDPVDLDEMARAMHVSTFYFCKMFRKATGLDLHRLSRARASGKGKESPAKSSPPRQ
jgi:AraC-like DNA-binding protein